MNYLITVSNGGSFHIVDSDSVTPSTRESLQLHGEIKDVEIAAKMLASQERPENRMALGQGSVVNYCTSVNNDIYLR